MDLLDRMNGMLDYIEQHLTDKIDYDQAAAIACCSTYHLQRMFPFIIDVPLSEYIRRRRLTLAAFDLFSATGSFYSSFFVANAIKKNYIAKYRKLIFDLLFSKVLLLKSFIF